ncbi:Gfo/Idh/MocA family oxidoreductase [Pontibacter brevis]
MPFLPINRRSFLKGATATLALTALGAHGISFANPAKTLRVGLIGTGWYGKSDLFRLMQVAPVEVVALCDVDKNMLAEAASLVNERQKLRRKPRLYEDYRKMLADNKFDIVLIGTPDHWHALPTVAAIKAGAHVYVQKPISVDVLEGEAMLAAARKYNRVVQVGTQRRSTPHLIEAKKNIIDAGLLGKVSHVEMYCYYHMRSNANPPEQPVPDFLNYDFWAGPAPLRPYDGLPHRRWRNYMEYSNGIVGDMCIHMFDAARWMLQLGWPKRIHSTGGIYVQKEGAANTADTQTATFEYDGLNCVWQHRTWGTPVNPDYPWGLTIYGEKGTLLASPHQYDFIPVDESGEKVHRDALYEKETYPEDLKEEGIELHAAPATRRHMQDFLAAIDKGSRPVADIEEGHISTASCILANLSMALGRPLVYDPVRQEVKGDPEATALLQRPYRLPWVHPDATKV